jgi:hypothetical protein
MPTGYPKTASFFLNAHESSEDSIREKVERVMRAAGGDVRICTLLLLCCRFATYEYESIQWRAKSIGNLDPLNRWQPSPSVAPAYISVPTPIRRTTVGSVRPIQRGTQSGRAGDRETAAIIASTLASMGAHPVGEYLVRDTVP